MIIYHICANLCLNPLTKYIQMYPVKIFYLHWQKTRPAGTTTERREPSEESWASCPTGNGSPPGATALHRRDTFYLRGQRETQPGVITQLCAARSGSACKLYLLRWRRRRLHFQQRWWTAEWRSCSASRFPEMSVGTVFIRKTGLMQRFY